MSKKPSQIINGFSVSYSDKAYHKFSVGDLVMVDGGYFNNGIAKLGVVEDRRDSVFPLYNVYVFEKEQTYTALHENEITAI